MTMSWSHGHFFDLRGDDVSCKSNLRVGLDVLDVLEGRDALVLGVIGSNGCCSAAVNTANHDLKEGLPNSSSICKAK